MPTATAGEGSEVSSVFAAYAVEMALQLSNSPTATKYDTRITNFTFHRRSLQILLIAAASMPDQPGRWITVLHEAMAKVLRF
ncbi:hypothetical protein [Hyphomicrobium denitrificans]|uniref:hypothetical protein n=1 Tax=Hyphomicrobium denitrificans TaxID=53399 RepID=UPI00145D4BC4|nr:hypothetical protein [Hyphomicrobium denitrificans]